MNKRFLYLTMITLILSGCGGVKDSLGLNKESPDEFAVIKRAPLEMPSSLALPPPTPGAARPQEKAPIVQAKQAIFGNESTATTTSSSEAESALLQKANAANADPNIKYTIDAETKAVEKQNTPVIKKLFGMTGKEEDRSATVVDAEKEAQRIKKNQEEGKNITDGNTPVIKD